MRFKMLRQRCLVASPDLGQASACGRGWSLAQWLSLQPVERKTGFFPSTNHIFWSFPCWSSTEVCPTEVGPTQVCPPKRIKKKHTQTGCQGRLGDSSLWPAATVAELPRPSGTFPGPPESQIQIQNFQSNIQNPKSKLFGRGLDFDFGPLCSTLTQILDLGFWIWVLDSGFWILDFGFWILDSRLWISDLGFWILQFGVSCSSSFCADFGFWILNFGFWYTFWTLHQIRILGTPTRVGGFTYR